MHLASNNLTKEFLITRSTYGANSALREQRNEFFIAGTDYLRTSTKPIKATVYNFRLEYMSEGETTAATT